MPTETAVSDAILIESRHTLDQSVQKILHCLNQLSDADMHYRPHPSTNSISNILLHLCGNLRQWLIAPVSRQPDTRNRPAEFSDRHPYSRQELIDRLKSTVAECDRALQSLAAEPHRLLERRHIQEWDVTLLAAIFSTVSHFVGPTHQIVHITRLRLGDAYKFHWTPREPGQTVIPV